MRWKRIAVYGIVAVAIAGWFVLTFLHLEYGTAGPQNPEEEGQKCASCLNALTMTSSNAGWAAGDGYFLLRYADGVWDWVRRPTRRANFSMTAGANGELWATGDESLHFDGTSWQELPYPSGQGFLYGVSTTGPDNAWFAGDKVWRYHTGEWTFQALPEGVSAHGVAMLSDSDGWAVGAHYTDNKVTNGEILRYQNGSWIEAAATPGKLSAIAMMSPVEGWAAGEDANGDGVFYHYDGVQWSLFSTVSGAAVDHLSVSPSGDVWAIGYHSEDDTSLYHYASGAWTRVALPEGITIRSTSSAASEDVWLVGRTIAEGPDGYWHGVILHYHEGQWLSLKIPPRPPANAWTIPLKYGALAYLLLLLLPLALGFLIYSLRAPEGSAWRRWYSRYLLVWAIAFCLYMITLFGSSLLYPDLLNGVSANIVAVSFGGIIFLPFTVLLVLMLLAGEDMSFQQRRHT